MKTLFTLLTSLSLFNTTSNCAILTTCDFIPADYDINYEETESNLNYDIDLMDYVLFPE